MTRRRIVRRLPLVMLASTVLAGTVLGVAVLAGSAVPRGGPAFRGAAAGWSRLTAFLLDRLARGPGRHNPQRFSDGVWLSADNACWACSVGPGTAAAVLAGTRRDPASLAYRDLAVATFDTAIAAHQQSDGSFAPSQAQPDAGISTIFFASELGTAYLELAPVLDAAHRARWAQALTGAADYLVSKRHALTFYVNGNINLQITEVLFMAWRASSDSRYREAYERSWDFTLHPPPPWSTFGIRIVRAPTRNDGADGAGFLAESGGSAPGFDADYTHLQADVAARLYLYSGDRRALWLTNVLTNMLLTRVDRSRWMLDTSGGSRHPQAGRLLPFTTPAVATLAWLGGRSDLRRDVQRQLRRLRAFACGGLTYSYHPVYRAVGTEVGAVLKAAEMADPARASAHDTSARTLCPNLPRGYGR